MKKVAPVVPQKQVQVTLLVDQTLINGEIVLKNETSKLKVTEWLAKSMVAQGVAKLGAE